MNACYVVQVSKMIRKRVPGIRIQGEPCCPGILQGGACKANCRSTVPLVACRSTSQNCLVIGLSQL